MFKVAMSDIDVLKSSIPILAEIVDEAVFKFNQNGISVLTPDRTMVAVIDYQLLSSAFDKFEIQEEQSIGLNLANLVSVIKRIGSKDRLTIEFSGGNKLKFIVEGRGKRVFEIPVLNITSEKPPVDQLKFVGKIELDSDIIEEGISDADVIGDSVIFEAGPDNFKLSARSDVSSTQLEMKKGEPGLHVLEVEQAIRSRYPLDYLKKMIKASKMSKQTTLEFGTDFPLRINFKALDKMKLSFILAPRVEE
ncbi:MAG: DNA polymerase sliding clamp [Nanoarchaeota archaeon]|nr:DNA polymerase sliding clamp [Nanoarchaeota archaeon]MBU1135038.1 DNA polymerase sliding clamp [Nanoarchaeota archaeon]MBU2520324.1 DNA polymerase sliding clamp [Nanoarchaeota archaeon]